MNLIFRHIKAKSRIILPTIAAFAALSASLPALSESCEVLIIKNAELKPYEAVIRGFKDTCNCDVQELKLPVDEGREKILEDSPDAVLAVGTTVFKQIKTINLPLIYTMVIPSEAESSQAENISGVSMDISPEAYISAIRDVFPGAKKIGLFYDPRYSRTFVEGASQAAHTAGIELIEKKVSDPGEIPGLLTSLRDKMDVFWMVPDPTIVAPEAVDFLLRFSFHNNLPIFSFSKKYVEMGAIAALDVDPYDMGVQAGEILKKLSKGRTEPIRVYARRSHLTINQNVAAKMGIKIGDEAIRKVK